MLRIAHRAGHAPDCCKKGLHEENQIVSIAFDGQSGLEIAKLAIVLTGGRSKRSRELHVRSR
jgi:hypothetical protein